MPTKLMTWTVGGYFDPSQMFLTNGGGDSSSPTVTVPSNKLVIVESIVAVASMPSGQKAGLQIAVQEGDSSPEFRYPLVLFPQVTYTERDGTQRDVLHANNPMRIYFPTGPDTARLVLIGTRGLATDGEGYASATITGYVQDV